MGEGRIGRHIDTAIFDGLPFCVESRNWTVAEADVRQCSDLYFLKCSRWFKLSLDPSWFAREVSRCALVQARIHWELNGG
jgi:hypothetical protein